MPGLYSHSVFTGVDIDAAHRPAANSRPRLTAVAPARGFTNAPATERDAAPAGRDPAIAVLHADIAALRQRHAQAITAAQQSGADVGFTQGWRRGTRTGAIAGLFIGATLPFVLVQLARAAAAFIG